MDDTVTPSAEAVPATPKLTAAEALSLWAQSYLRDSAYSRDTAALNTINHHLTAVHSLLAAIDSREA